jgi:hypothetical protein
VAARLRVPAGVDSVRARRDAGLTVGNHVPRIAPRRLETPDRTEIARCQVTTAQLAKADRGSRRNNVGARISTLFWATARSACRTNGRLPPGCSIRTCLKFCSRWSSRLGCTKKPDSQPPHFTSHRVDVQIGAVHFVLWVKHPVSSSVHSRRTEVMTVKLYSFHDIRGFR